MSTVQYTILYSTLESPFERYQNNTAMYIWSGCTSPCGEINFGLEGEYGEGQHHRSTDTNRHQHLQQAEVKDKFRGGLYKDVLKTLHTAAFKSTLDSYQPNRVLGTKPPDINPEEKTLTRSVRCKLTRLRSGSCRSLNSYMSRIDNGITDVACPKCDSSPHDTRNLFNCHAGPTNLTVIDLWTRPFMAAEFLKLTEDDEPTEDH